MPTRKKLIVYITMSGFDSSFAVLAESRENGFIAVEGSQLLLASVDESDARFVNKEALYHLYRDDYKVKCYDCFTFNSLGKRAEPTVSTSYVMRCSGYNPDTGNPGFLPKEALAAGVPAFKIERYLNSEGLLYIKASMLRAC